MRASSTKEILTSCPICLNNRFLNRLSKDSFYCTSCLNEFKVKNEKTYLVEIDPDTGEFKIRTNFLKND